MIMISGQLGQIVNKTHLNKQPVYGVTQMQFQQCGRHKEED
jgi:hypothetical protein